MMSGNKKHILITGSHRSGTTWVGQTISQHKDIVYLHEPFNVSCPNKLVGLTFNDWFTDIENLADKEEVVRILDNLLLSKPWTHYIERAKNTGLDIYTQLRLINFLFSRIQKNKRLLIKDPISLFSAGWLYENYNFNVVCMIRNPWGFVASLKNANWYFDFSSIKNQQTLVSRRLPDYVSDIDRMCCNKNNDIITNASLLWNILHSVILEYREKYNDWIFVKHEDIAANPHEEYKKIFTYIEQNPDDIITRYINKFTSSRNPDFSRTTSYQPRNSKAILDLWKNTLSREEIERITYLTKDVATCFYDTPMPE